MITYSINAHPVIALMFSQTGTDVLPRRDEGSDKPSATIEPHRIMVPTRIRTQAAGLKSDVVTIILPRPTKRSPREIFYNMTQSNVLQLLLYYISHPATEFQGYFE